MDLPAMTSLTVRRLVQALMRQSVAPIASSVCQSPVSAPARGGYHLTMMIAALVLLALSAACVQPDVAGPSAALASEAVSGVATESSAASSRRTALPAGSRWENECKAPAFKLVLHEDGPRVSAVATGVPVVDAWVIHEPTTGPWLVRYYPPGLLFEMWPPEAGKYRLIAWWQGKCGTASWTWPTGATDR